MNAHLTAMHPSLPRSIAPKPNNQMPVTVSIANMAVSPPPPLQISPPLHQHLNMQQHPPLAMQQPLGNQLPMQVQSALHSPPMQQVSACTLDSDSEVQGAGQGQGGGMMGKGVSPSGKGGGMCVLFYIMDRKWKIVNKHLLSEK